MTKQSDILHDPNYTPVLDHGFVGLIDHMGSDAAIVQAARVSYGAGTKSIREDRGLIRYLIRNAHWSPIEMGEIKLHIKLPVFCMRQLVRHRTANLNEYSGRYSEMSDEFYLPDPDVIMAQSQDNKQGRSGEVDDRSKMGVRWLLNANYEHSYDTYMALLGDREGRDGGDVIYDPYNGEDALLSDDFPGVAREMARLALPVANYTELYWKQDLRNMLHLLKLRADSHAQYEIRMYADAIYQIVRPLFPLTVEAWEDYVRDAVTASRMEKTLLLELLASDKPSLALSGMISAGGGEARFAESRGMSLRELRDFIKNWNLG